MKEKLKLPEDSEQQINYTTGQELTFLENLGSFYEGPFRGKGGSLSETKEERRVRLLKNYKKSIPLRANWGDVDKDVIMLCLEPIINDEELRALES